MNDPPPASVVLSHGINALGVLRALSRRGIHVTAIYFDARSPVRYSIAANRKIRLDRPEDPTREGRRGRTVARPLAPCTRPGGDLRHLRRLRRLPVAPSRPPVADGIATGRCVRNPGGAPERQDAGTGADVVPARDGPAIGGSSAGQPRRVVRTPLPPHHRQAAIASAHASPRGREYHPGEPGRRSAILGATPGRIGVLRRAGSDRRTCGGPAGDVPFGTDVNLTGKLTIVSLIGVQRISQHVMKVPRGEAYAEVHRVLRGREQSRMTRVEKLQRPT